MQEQRGIAHEYWPSNGAALKEGALQEIAMAPAN
jgi:hypothetical protein